MSGLAAHTHTSPAHKVLPPAFRQSLEEKKNQINKKPGNKPHPWAPLQPEKQPGDPPRHGSHHFLT